MWMLAVVSLERGLYLCSASVFLPTAPTPIGLGMENGYPPLMYVSFGAGR